jgi:hypothetical protein
VTVSPASTSRSAPASAVGCPFTVTVAESESDPPRPSSTVSSNVSVAGPAGAVNVGSAVVDPVTVTAGPAVCTQL